MSNLVFLLHLSVHLLTKCWRLQWRHTLYWSWSYRRGWLTRNNPFLLSSHNMFSYSLASCWGPPTCSQSSVLSAHTVASPNVLKVIDPSCSVQVCAWCSSTDKTQWLPKAFLDLWSLQRHWRLGLRWSTEGPEGGLKSRLNTFQRMICSYEPDVGTHTVGRGRLFTSLDILEFTIGLD